MSEETSYNPRTGHIVAVIRHSSPSELTGRLSSAALAAPELAKTPPGKRATWLRAIADAMEEPSVCETLVALADAETALGEERLAAELVRTAGQLRFYAEVAEEGSFLGVTRDRAVEQAPQLSRMMVPLGPVAVFGASNFPFAFGVLGNDTASALASGCPVLAKAHPAHPQLSVALASVAHNALSDAGAPEGTFALVVGFEAGTTLVRSEDISAVAFTGSQRGGLALWKAATERPVPIPVFAEMGTVNPVVVTPSVTSLTDVARGFVGSFTLSAGQYCTKPGLLLAPRGREMASEVTRALQSADPQGWALTESIVRHVITGIDRLVESNARLVAQVAGPSYGWSVPATVLEVPLDSLQADGRLLEECFGPVALIAEYDDMAEVRALVPRLPGALAASVMTAGPEDPDTAGLVAALSTRVGRVAVDQWPTGVAFRWAQQHGGPWPATTRPASTSVGAAALERFVRPVAFQSVPDAALPPALQEANPWGLRRRVDGAVG
jgi:NADP-dependent aldehyde dehydrogenase